MRIGLSIVIALVLVPLALGMPIVASPGELEISIGESKSIHLLSDQKLTGTFAYTVSQELDEIIRVTKNKQGLEVHALPEIDVTPGVYEGFLYVTYITERAVFSGARAEQDIPVAIKVIVAEPTAGISHKLEHEVLLGAPIDLSGNIIFLLMIVATLIAVMFTSYRKLQHYAYHKR